PRSRASETSEPALSTASSSISGPILTPSSVPRPIPKPVTSSVKRRANSTATERCTMKRFAAVQAWPMLRNFAFSAPSTAASRSASSNTTKGALPPSSIEVRSTPGAAWDRSFRPTSVEPVKESLRSRGSARIGSETVLEELEVTTLTTPSGSPASSSSFTKSSVVSGVSCAGLSTTVQPAASAGAVVDHALGQPGLLEQLHEEQRGQRRELRGLDHHGAAGRERGGDLARRHREREVPRGDEIARPHRVARDDRPPRVLGVRAVAALDAHRLLAEPAQELPAVGDLAAGFGQRLAHLERHQQGEVLGPLGEQVEGPPQQLAPLPGRGARPGGERVGGRIHRGLRIGARGRRDGAEHLAGGGVADVEGLPALRGAPAPADEQLLGDARQQLLLTLLAHGSPSSLVIRRG